MPGYSEEWTIKGINFKSENQGELSSNHFPFALCALLLVLQCFLYVNASWSFYSCGFLCLKDKMMVHSVCSFDFFLTEFTFFAAQMSTEWWEMIEVLSVKKINSLKINYLTKKVGKSDFNSVIHLAEEGKILRLQKSVCKL